MKRLLALLLLALPASAQDRRSGFDDWRDRKSVV